MQSSASKAQAGPSGPSSGAGDSAAEWEACKKSWYLKRGASGANEGESHGGLPSPPPRTRRWGIRIPDWRSRSIMATRRPRRLDSSEAEPDAGKAVVAIAAQHSRSFPEAFVQF